MVGAYSRSLSFTSCLSRHSKHGMAGAYCRSRPFTSCLSRHSKHGIGNPTVGHGPSHRACHATPSNVTEWWSLQTRVLLSVTALHIVPVTSLQTRNGGSPTVGHGPSHLAFHVTPSCVEGYYPSDGGLAVEWVAWCRLVLVADAERNLLLAVRAILNFFLFLRLDQLLSFLVTEGPHHASAFPQGGPADVRHVVHLSITQLARECPCSPRLLSRL